MFQHIGLEVTKLKVAFLALALGLTTFSYSAQTLTYTKKTGDKKTEFTWVINKENNKLDVTWNSGGQVVTIEAILPYMVQTFSMKSTKNSDHYTFKKDKGTLSAKGSIKNNEMQESYKIGKTFWVQEFELGLKPFLQSSKETYKFVILNPKNFKMHKMIATKLEKEDVEIGGKKVKAQKVKITLQGLKSVFWKALAWYDLSNHDMLIYEANEGPHTPTSRISLTKSEGDSTSFIHGLEEKLHKGKSDVKQDIKVEESQNS